MPSLKPGWKRYRFDEIAVNVNKRVDNPAKAGVEHYVGLEHLDADSLKIRRWGSPLDVAATKLLFEPGDVIFGRRRAYQRKLGVAEFKGIASAHSLVLRARPQVILPNFLPFFMQSDTFMERAIKISVGSLSPTVNWKALAKEEFALPPLEEQLKQYKILSAMEHLIQETLEMNKTQRQMKVALIEEVVKKSNNWLPINSLIVDSSYGSSSRAFSEPSSEGIPILRIPNILRDAVDFSDLKFVKLSTKEVGRYSLQKGDILVVRTNGNPNNVGRCVAVPQLTQAYVYASYLIRLRVRDKDILPQFLVAVLNSATIRRYLRGSVRSSAGNFNINTQGLRSQKIPRPPIEVQSRVIKNVTQLNHNIKLLEERLEHHKILKHTFLNAGEHFV